MARIVRSEEIVVVVVVVVVNAVRNALQVDGSIGAVHGHHIKSGKRREDLPWLITLQPERRGQDVNEVPELCGVRY